MTIEIYTLSSVTLSGKYKYRTSPFLFLDDHCLVQFSLVLHAESSCILQAKEFLLYFTWPFPVKLLRVQVQSFFRYTACQRIVKSHPTTFTFVNIRAHTNYVKLFDIHLQRVLLLSQFNADDENVPVIEKLSLYKYSHSLRFQVQCFIEPRDVFCTI